jgi:hypothetical protein
MPVTYGGVEIRPGPRVAINIEHRLTGDGRRLTDVVTATLRGDLVPEKIDGVEAAVPIEARLSTILSQQKFLRDTFAVDGKIFQVQGWDDGVPVRFPARVRSISLPEGIWVSDSQYEIVLEGPSISGEDAANPYVESCNESWQIEEDEQTWLTKVQHTVQAKGVSKMDGVGGIETPAWQNARTFAKTKLGLGWTTIGDSYWSPQSGQTIAAGSAATLASTLAWNPVHSDTVDEIEGTYSATETWVLGPSAYWEEARIGVKTSDADPSSMVAVSLGGTIHGLFQASGDFASKYANAVAGWEAVRDTLLDRAQGAAGSATISPHPVTAEVDFSVREGTVSYQYEFNNRTLVADTWEVYGVSPHASLEDYRTTVGVSGTIYGVAYPDEDTNPALRLERALARWEDVRGLLFARAVSGTGLTDLKAFPVNAEYTPDPSNGSVSYQYQFDNRDPEDVEVEYTVDRRYSRENGQTTVQVSGSVKGLRHNEAADPFQPADREERYQNALAYFNQLEPNLLGVAATYVDVESLNATPWNKGVSHNPLAGSIGFQYEFTSNRGPCTPGALSEVLNIVDTFATPVIARIPIPGKPEGPIVQDMATITEGEREVSIEVVFPQGLPCAASPPSDVDLTGYAPQGNNVKVVRNTRSWSPTGSRLNRTMAWIYTQ